MEKCLFARSNNSAFCSAILLGFGIITQASCVFLSSQQILLCILCQCVQESSDYFEDCFFLQKTIFHKLLLCHLLKISFSLNKRCNWREYICHFCSFGYCNRLAWWNWCYIYTFDTMSGVLTRTSLGAEHTIAAIWASSSASSASSSSPNSPSSDVFQ